MSSDSSSSSSSRQRWCICRSTDTARFMIGCDKCEEWFHGDCIGVTPKQADGMLNYYCRRCLKRNPNLKIVWKAAEEPTAISASSASTSGEVQRRPLPAPPSSRPQQFSVQASAAMTQPLPPQPSLQTQPSAPSTAPQQQQQQQQQQHQPSPQSQKRSRQQQRRHLASTKTSAAATTSAATKTAARASHSHGGGNWTPRQQCEGPGCRQSAARGSAYCCESCGLARARRRLVALLPPRLTAWQARAPVAERRDSLRLARVRQSADAARRRLTEGELRHQALDRLLARARRLPPGMPEEPGLPGEDDVIVPCPSCSLETSVRTALRHLLKCQLRIESRTSFGSPFPSQMDGTRLFCDRFCQASRSYCKKLAVLCPDHYRGDAAEAEHGACGCPLTNDEVAGQLCPVARQKCTRHFAWARLRRAEIDIDRMRQLMRLEELLFEERSIRQAMMQRGGALSLLLHSTTDHQPGTNLPVVEAPNLGAVVPPNHIL